MSSAALSVAIRPIEPYETPLVYSSWLRSYRTAADPHVGQVVFFKRHHELIESILSNPSTLVTVLTADSSPGTVLGWACRTGTTLHYVYVKEAFRRMGFGTQLAGGFDTHTHLTKYGKWLLVSRARKSGAESVYDPYAVT